MSVSDPLIKEIKGYALQLFNDATSFPITDSNQTLHKFCRTTETIFHQGLAEKNINPYLWMISTSSNFTYKSCIEEVQGYKNVHTAIGKFRLLVRHCLKKNCLHVPVELLRGLGKNGIYYDKKSILGDEILSAIFLSVLLQCSKISFDLGLTNSYFLDESWEIPTILKLQMVPCKTLGVSVSFTENRAIVVDVQPGGVAAECGDICRGDMLANINGIDINSSSKGRLSSIMRSSKGRPINVIIIKAFHAESQEAFAPLLQVLQNLKIETKRLKIKKTSLSPRGNGFKGLYLGTIPVGSKGSIKQIEETMTYRMSELRKKDQRHITFEIGEMCVRVFDLETKELIMKHSYMQISSCGSKPDLPNYFAYIAGKEFCDVAPAFTCYLFYMENTEVATTILQSIGQGFYRTHFAV